jgi:beta-galactosidase
VHIETTVQNGRVDSADVSIESIVIGPAGQEVGRLASSQMLQSSSDAAITQDIRIGRPQLWSLQSPALYTLRSRVLMGETAVDEVTTPFGIRTLRFDPDEGFFLNGTPLKLKGVCLHHDAGSLGAAVPLKVLERQLQLMKELGANAVRTSHNPPAPELLDLCDRMGFLVQDEAFDEFTPPKNKWVQGRNVAEPARFGYGEIFAQWSVEDISDMVRRDRNHPCIIMWSIGNEIDYPNDPFSHPVLGNRYRPQHPPAENLVKHAGPLIDAVKKYDETRPVTAALASIPMSNAVGLAQMLDVVGYNYQEQHYEADHETYPRRFIYGSENGDAYNAWTAVRDNDYVAGQFLWTGIDYLGEAGRWPNRANGAGLFDLCGFKKPIGWFRQSLWSDEPMVYICASPQRSGRRGRGRGGRGAEHWNWPEDSTTTVTCYTNCPEVVLTLNDRPISTQALMQAEQGALTWDVPYEPGTLKAVGRRDGTDVCEYVLQTAGRASRIVVRTDLNALQADGKDVCHIELQIVDARGVRVPDAEHELIFDVSGPATLIGIGNANLSDTSSTKDLVHPAYEGRALAILQAGREPGSVRVTVRAEGLQDASLDIDVRSTDGR